MKETVKLTKDGEVKSQTLLQVKLVLFHNDINVTKCINNYFVGGVNTRCGSLQPFPSRPVTDDLQVELSTVSLGPVADLRSASVVLR